MMIHVSVAAACRAYHAKKQQIRNVVSAVV